MSAHNIEVKEPLDVTSSSTTDVVDAGGIVDITLSDESVEHETRLVLQDWHAFCVEQSNLHNRSRERKKIFNYAMAIPAILLSTISGTANIGIGSGDCGTRNNWISIMFGAMGLVSASLFTVHRYLRLPELQQEHDFYADEYEKLALTIEMHLVLTDNEEAKTFKNLGEFMKECKKDIDLLIDKAPAVASLNKPKYVKPSRSAERCSTLKFIK